MTERYRTIVADPPWEHEARRRTEPGMRLDGARITVPLPYPTMSVDEIAALPVGDLAESDAHLYLWTTNRYIRFVWDIAEGWGFCGVNLIAWCKPLLGQGGGGAWQSNVEFCLFARRGNLPTHGNASGRWYAWPRRKGPPVKAGERRVSMHSAKPDAFLDLVEQVSPGPYAELFARRARFGWDYPIGDQSLGGVAA